MTKEYIIYLKLFKKCEFNNNIRKSIHFYNVIYRSIIH